MKETDFDAIGARLELLRRVIGENQNEFAARAGILPNTYNQYAKGKKRPSIENAIALCEVHELTLDWIYRGDNSGLTRRLALRAISLRRCDCSS